MNDTVEAVEGSRSEQFLNRGVAILEVIALAALLGLMVHTLANVIGRRFFASPIAGTIEYVGFWYLPIAALLGFIVAQFRGEHIKAPLIYGRLSKEGQRDLTVFGAVICAAVCAGFTWFSSKEALEKLANKAVSGALEVPIWPVTLLVPVVFAVLTVQFVVEGISTIMGRQLPSVTENLPNEGLLELIEEAEKAEFGHPKREEQASAISTFDDEGGNDAP